MITNKNATNLELLSKLAQTETKLNNKKNINDRDRERYNNIKLEILKRMDNTNKEKEIKQNIRLKFVSTPSHGYLIVPCEIMDKYPEIKEKISCFSWIANGNWYLEEDIDAPLFLEKTKIKNIEYKDTEDDFGMDVMSPHHPEWDVFYDRLCYSLNKNNRNGCDNTHRQTRFTLLRYFPVINVEKTMKYLTSHGGCCCDCEVLYNVEDGSDNF